MSLRLGGVGKAPLRAMKARRGENRLEVEVIAPWWTPVCRYVCGEEVHRHKDGGVREGGSGSTVEGPEGPQRWGHRWGPRRPSEVGHR